MAIERFSDLVNATPAVLTDQDVVFSDVDVDTCYFFRIVNAAEPYLPSGMSDTTRQERIAAFGALKAQAGRQWENAGLASVTGQIREFRPAGAQPVDWYDLGSTAGWQRRTFTIAGSARAPAPQTLQWQLPPSPQQVATAVELPATAVPDLPVTEVIRRAALLQRGIPASLIRGVRPARPAPPPPAVPATGAPRVADGRILLRRAAPGDLARLSLGDRMLAKTRLLRAAPVAASTTNTDTTVTFNARVVRIDRPWWFWPLLTDTTWMVPGISRGGITRLGTAGALPWLPIGMLVICNMKIVGAWSPEDVEMSGQATNFGPFPVSGKISGGELSSPGMQVIGWLLQQMPELPPNEEAAAPPVREYTVVKGDTLWGIALMMYGDSDRWPAIADANKLADPGQLRVGARLTIP
ncbi:LysM peptidoglycan-binding domain-containing protein [Actinoplanes sp. NPDC051633]|uniref:LysM peptidoglycan-binding domain-containing protein n=1 Tax=Actinoplanes sp. NPDC051633 TaxID=3155670 RepID=UPI003420BC0A